MDRTINRWNVNCFMEMVCMVGFDAKKYGTIVADLLHPTKLAPLDSGRPNVSVRALLQGLSDNPDFLGKPIRDKQMACACISGLWLYHDFLEESHAISQEISSSAGSYWHGILHRREPDFPNSGYWFHRVGNFATFEELKQATAEILGDSPPDWARFMIGEKRWDPFAFIDLCERALGGNVNAIPICQRIAQKEWELLFDYCYRAAVGYE